MNTSYGITSKYQVTIPKEVRDELHITEDTRVTFERRGDEIILRKAVQPMTIQEVQAMNQRLLKARGVGKVSDIDMKQAREKFDEHGGTWQ